MAAPALTASEHQTLSVGEGADLTPAEAALLARVAQQRRGFCSLGHRSLRLAQYVGLVNLGGRVLEVLPKIGEDADPAQGRGTLLRMLRLAYDLPAFEQGGVGHGLRQCELLDVFVLAYLRALLQLVRAGLLRRYRTREDDLGVVRGRMLLQRQAAVHAMRVDRLACRFDELTLDNPWNQVLKAALLAVRPWARGLESGRLWLEMAAALDEVSVRHDALALQATLASDRQVHHYAAALQWAGWILRLLSPDLRAGASQAPELLFDMNRLFEAAVATRLRGRAFAAGWHLSAQDGGFSLATLESEPDRPFFRLRPDLVLREGTQVLAVADTKWSRLEMDRVGRLVPGDAHVYQLNAYASVYPCEEVALIYPWHRGLEGAHPTAFRLPGAGARQPLLRVVCIDVGSDDLPLRAVAASSRLARLATGGA
ncbi:5-methylcytosine-specific restriction enzyme subunit McrC [Lysobacter sp. yr284]|uniref:McrC family protein n=1 Tax=Lysobacter sp. yr284 TaxID=1761791 RepID=UPI000898326D|nr:hypothetical protein [Lysobacter sp. yr284]SDY21187.1 5-methylcytosine-specific restriction enzyme subunit McrC [Lysobacter sp. yr284]